MGGSANRMKGSWTVWQTGGEKPGLGEAWPLCLSDEKGLGRRWTIVRSAFPPPSSAQPGKGSGEGPSHQETLCTANFLLQKWTSLIHSFQLPAWSDKTLPPPWAQVPKVGTAASVGAPTPHPEGQQTPAPISDPGPWSHVGEAHPRSKGRSAGPPASRRALPAARPLPAPGRASHPTPTPSARPSPSSSHQREGEGRGHWTLKNSDQTLTLLFSSCMTLGRSLSLSKPQCPVCKKS